MCCYNFNSYFLNFYLISQSNLQRFIHGPNYLPPVKLAIAFASASMKVCFKSGLNFFTILIKKLTLKRFLPSLLTIFQIFWLQILVCTETSSATAGVSERAAADGGAGDAAGEPRTYP